MVGTLWAHFPGLRVVVERGTLCFAVNDYLCLVAYFGSVGRLVAGVWFCCYVGCLLLGGTQADDSGVFGLRVLTLHLRNYTN